MIVVMKSSATKEEVLRVTDALIKKGMQVQTNKGVDCTVLGVLGDTYTVDKERVGMMNGVDRVVSVQEPYKKANRKFHPEDSVVNVNGVPVGGGTLTVMAGPCSVESFPQLEGIAVQCKASGAQILRGGAFKPRTSPYAFQGLGEQGLDILEEVRRETGMPIVTEIMAPRYVELFSEKADIIQIGARNMQNFDLLKEVGQTKKPILLKRGLSSTIEELLMSAEYIMSGGNENVILCERGIRTFETYTRNTLDISAIPAIKKLSHLPVVVDPSHASGLSYMVESLALAAVAAGADGLLIEVHNDPKHALCDGAQSLTPEAFDGIMHKINALKSIMS
ncbi:3-deoxy-7-phosphoheptulonate synthase [Christensenella tenuis]|jgi:3-deoxy-7-phosphoheptulonate synthase|uniref:3-deoxy-7-phosphoheptulonate synthase n=1 Tax=Christensenella tenuis TaxID=2763033 RepID=A0ABR7ED36_9FIRM|nr:3-deoxy-7-phosphoheptulonate synthase [Christensenella tenuis]MBC5647014.1 3-deoxy-7-phosphoheptulonate synthase [Christensenella tenuis]